MKYLKYLTENFKQDEFYVEISEWEYRDYLLHKKDSFNKREIDFLKDNLSKEFTVDYYPRAADAPMAKIVIGFYTPKAGWVNTYINKLEDSYFIINGIDVTDYHYFTYKCDQFEGLVQLLKDKGIINK